MAKIIPMELIKNMSGKVCMHSDTYFQNRYGQTYTGKICNPRTTPYSGDELKQQSRFKAASAAALNRASNPSTRTADMASFQAQKNQPNGKKTLRGYLFSIAYAHATYDDSTETWNVNWPN